jgi:hypothetical protein
MTQDKETRLEQVVQGFLGNSAVDETQRVARRSVDFSEAK